MRPSEFRSIFGTNFLKKNFFFKCYICFCLRQPFFALFGCQFIELFGLVLAQECLMIEFSIMLGSALILVVFKLNS